VSQEIVFTSAERGLRSGSTGFCTVRSTAGMPANTASVLEQLTGYTHAFDAYDRNVMDRHPVNYAHYITQVAGQRLHILGRISNAPLDHTNRSNKLAHLLAIDDDEIDLARTRGPAAVIEQRIASRGKQLDSKDAQFWMTEWSSDREPVVLPDSKTYQVPAERDAPVLCNTWKQVLGDAGWAATLADSIHDRKRKTVPIVFSVEQKDLCLALVTEALSLLPPEERWDVTFSTFYSGSLPTKVECRWQFLLDSTDLAKKALRTAHRNPVIDLTSLRGTPAEPNELTPFVLSKDRPWLSTSRKRPEQRIPRNPGFRPPREQDDFDAASSDADVDSDGTYSLGGDYDSYSSKRRPGSPERQTNWMPKVVIGCAVLLFILCGIILLPGSSSKPTDEFSQLAQADQAKSAKQREEELVQQRIAQRQKERAPEPPKRREPVPEAPDPTPAITPVKQSKPESDSIAAVPTPDRKAVPQKTDKPAPDHLPFDFIRSNLDGRLSLPEPPRGTLSRQTNTDLATVHLDSALDCHLSILGSESVLKPGNTFDVTTQDIVDLGKPIRKWHISITQPKSGLSRKQVVGTFTLADGTLSFRWDPGATLELQNAEVQLDAQIGETADSIVCSLRSPRYHDVAGVSNDPDKRRIVLIDQAERPRPEAFVLDCTVSGLPEHYSGKTTASLKIPTEQNRAPGIPKPNLILIKGAQDVDGTRYSLMELEIAFEQDTTGSLVLQIALWYTIPVLDKQGNLQLSRQRFVESVFEQLPTKNREKLATANQALREVKEAIAKLEPVLADLKKKAEKQPDKPVPGLPGASAEMQRLTSARQSIERIESILVAGTTWQELISRDLARLKENIEIRYELKRLSSTSEGVTEPIVATRG